MILLDGKKISQEIQYDLQERIDKLLKIKRRPGLGIILVGNNPASISYVNMKKKKCLEMDILTTIYHFQDNISEKSLEI